MCFIPSDGKPGLQGISESERPIGLDTGFVKEQNQVWPLPLWKETEISDSHSDGDRYDVVRREREGL